MYENLSLTRKNDFWELPENVQCTSDLRGALEFADHVFIVISAQGMRNLSPVIAKCMADNKIAGKTFILCMKGIDEVSNETLSQLLRRELNAQRSNAQSTNKKEKKLSSEHCESSIDKICVWLGPGHIEEFLSGQPGVMLVDGECPKTTMRIAEEFKSDIMKLYVGSDLVGAEVGAAAKNVLGIGAGVLDGANMGSLKGALMARGVWEVSRLIVAMGGNQKTAYGLSHLGDFEATLFSRNSNNRRFGEQLIRHIQDNAQCINAQCTIKDEKMRIEHCALSTGFLDFAKKNNLPLAEGVATSKAMVALARKYKVDMPIATMVYNVLHKGKDPMDGFRELFMRGNQQEFGD